MAIYSEEKQECTPDKISCFKILTAGTHLLEVVKSNQRFKRHFYKHVGDFIPIIVNNGCQVIVIPCFVRLCIEIIH